MSNAEKYSSYLGSLEGDAFETEVCAHLQSCYLDFQRIPDSPQGDGGLDGLSHKQTRAYCCYGPEQEPFKTNTRGLKADILRKFRSDMRKLFELDTRSRRLVLGKTPELETILAPGAQIQAVFLIVSVFNDHRLIGALNKSFNEYKAKSECRFIAEEATLTVWGPEDLASKGAVDDYALRRAEQKAVLARATKVAERAADGELEDMGEFDEKFAWLLERFPKRRDLIENLRDRLARDWTLAITLDQELANTSASLHQGLEQTRKGVVVDALLRSGDASSAFELLDGMRSVLRNRLREQLKEELTTDLIYPLADGEMARLIGECPVDWRST